MVFIIKKRILLISTCLILSLCFIGIKKDEKVIETVALPVENKVIILDAGHGYPDGGGYFIEVSGM